MVDSDLPRTNLKQKKEERFNTINLAELFRIDKKTGGDSDEARKFVSGLKKEITKKEKMVRF